MLTTQEVEQFARLTLKQWNLSDVTVRWVDRSYYGAANVWKNQIEISRKSLTSFERFSLVLRHEIAHFLDYRERGTFERNGRNDFHGASFKRWCKVLGVSSSRFVY